MSASTTAEFTVTGMTCGHCASSVREEVGAVPGVVSTDVDVAAGRLLVTADGAIDDAAVIAAITEAGYQGRKA